MLRQRAHRLIHQVFCAATHDTATGMSTRTLLPAEAPSMSAWIAPTTLHTHSFASSRKAYKKRGPSRAQIREARFSHEEVAKLVRKGPSTQSVPAAPSATSTPMRHAITPAASTPPQARTAWGFDDSDDEDNGGGNKGRGGDGVGSGWGLQRNKAGRVGGGRSAFLAEEGTGVSDNARYSNTDRRGAGYGGTDRGWGAGDRGGRGGDRGGRGNERGGKGGERGGRGGDRRTYQRGGNDRGGRGVYGDRGTPQHQGTTTGGAESSVAQLRDQWQGDVVYGVSPVLAALQSKRRTLHALYIQQGLSPAARKDKQALRVARETAAAMGVPVHYVEKHDLNMISNNRPHQGLVLDCSHLQFESLNTLPAIAELDVDSPSPVWLALDEVTDPQNFGAALRCALYLGASGVLVCAKNSAPLSGVVSKASAGAMEVMQVHTCNHLPHTLGLAGEDGWTILGTSADVTAVPVSHYTLEGPTVLVLGSEGYGLRTTVARSCDAMLRIDGGDASGVVDSLNVSVATGILLHALLGKRG